MDLIEIAAIFAFATTLQKWTPCHSQKTETSVTLSPSMKTTVGPSNVVSTKEFREPFIPSTAPTFKPRITGSFSAPDEIVITAILEITNDFRSRHEAQSVVWDEELASFAKATDLIRRCVFGHTGSPYGENIAAWYSDAYTVISTWYNEGKFYWGQAFTPDTGHFTQLVWKDTERIGCAWTDCSSRHGNMPGYYIACEYDPPGNVIDENMNSFRKNVAPLQKDWPSLTREK